MTIEDIESNIYDSLLSMKHEKDNKNEKQCYKKIDCCIYCFASIVFFSIISLLAYTAYIYFKDW